MGRGLRRAAWVCGMAAVSVYAAGQPRQAEHTSAEITGPLDLSRTVSAPVLESTVHKPLPEEYIWTAGEEQPRSVYAKVDRNAELEPHFFRKTFSVGTVPAQATLYVAGPRKLRVWVNGTLADAAEADASQSWIFFDARSSLGMHVFAVDVAKLLRAGRNTVAVEAVRGIGVAGYANSALVHQETSGKVLVAKIVPAARGVNAPALAISDGTWKSSTKETKGWERAEFDDAGWKAAESFGAIESSIEMFQWNADAGLYDWPGYDGISGFLAHMPVTAKSVLWPYAGRGELRDTAALTGGTGEFAVKMPASALSSADAPSVVLDFGRELTGRVEIVSDSATPATVTVQLGESEPEMMKDPYLGVNQMVIAPGGTGYSPKSAFRYAKIAFVGGGPELRFKGIRVDHIYYPVKYAGSFESSDPLLNRLWEMGAYTAHLCMQDGVWDASKRDRGRWMGDLDVSGRVIDDVFGEKPLMEDTLDRLLGARREGAAGASDDAVDQQVNGIPGYSAFWFTGAAEYYRHTGSKEFLEREHKRMLELLALVDKEFDARSVYANKSNVWLFVDWSPELNGDTPETRRATTLEFYRGYKEAVWMLRELGDTANAEKYEARAEAIRKAANEYLFDKATGSYGPRWQTNAAAVVGGAAGPEEYGTIWKNVLSQVGVGSTRGWFVTPYYNYYVISAMAEMGHRKEALDWIRRYWGGMVAEGATSFWEAYDPDWYKNDFHASLQADNASGYFISLAHGWSAGPTAWLMEQVLGIQAEAAGFGKVAIRPDLVDLAWARGAEPTPHGLLKVEARKKDGGTAVTVDVPERVVAEVAVPVSAATGHVSVNGTTVASRAAEGGARQVVVLDHAGHFELTAR